MQFHPSQKSNAIDILNKQNEAFPNHPDILHLLSELLISNEMYTDSLTHIQTLISTSPVHSDKALQLMQKIIQVYPNHCLALEIIGNIYIQQENIIQALHYYEQCIDHYEDCTEIGFKHTLEGLQNNTHSPSQNKAKLLMAKINSKSNNINAALETISELKDSDVGLDAKLLNAAILIKNQDPITALTILNELSEKHPFQWSIHESKLTAFKQHTNALMNDSDQDALKRIVVR